MSSRASGVARLDASFADYALTSLYP